MRALASNVAGATPARPRPRRPGPAEAMARSDRECLPPRSGRDVREPTGVVASAAEPLPADTHDSPTDATPAPQILAEPPPPAAPVGEMVGRAPVLPDFLIVRQPGDVLAPTLERLINADVRLTAEIPEQSLQFVREVLVTGTVSARRVAARQLSGLWDHGRPGPSDWGPILLEAALANLDHAAVLNNLIDALGWGALPGLDQLAAAVLAQADFTAKGRILDTVEMALDEEMCSGSSVDALRLIAETVRDVRLRGRAEQLVGRSERLGSCW